MVLVNFLFVCHHCGEVSMSIRKGWFFVVVSFETSSVGQADGISLARTFPNVYQPSQPFIAAWNLIR